jgi:hypothetical protein
MQASQYGNTATLRQVRGRWKICQKVYKGLEILTETFLERRALDNFNRYPSLTFASATTTLTLASQSSNQPVLSTALYLLQHAVVNIHPTFSRSRPAKHGRVPCSYPGSSPQLPRQTPILFFDVQPAHGRYCLPSCHTYLCSWHDPSRQCWRLCRRGPSLFQQPSQQTWWNEPVGYPGRYVPGQCARFLGGW